MREKINRNFSEILQRQEPKLPTVLKEEQPESVFIRLGNEDYQDGKGWKLVVSGTGKTAPASPADLQLQNRFCSFASGCR